MMIIWEIQHSDLDKLCDGYELNLQEKYTPLVCVYTLANI